MATYTEKEEFKVEIIPPWNALQVRKTLITLKDGVELTRKFERWSRQPGQKVSLSDLSARTPSQAHLYCEEAEKIANALWDADHIAKYNQHVADQEAEWEKTAS